VLRKLILVGALSASLVFLTGCGSNYNSDAEEAVDVFMNGACCQEDGQIAYDDGSVVKVVVRLSGSSGEDVCVDYEPWLDVNPRGDSNVDWTLEVSATLESC
jgi:hypothetical protein